MRKFLLKAYHLSTKILLVLPADGRFASLCFRVKVRRRLKLATRLLQHDQCPFQDCFLLLRHDLRGRGINEHIFQGQRDSTLSTPSHDASGPAGDSRSRSRPSGLVDPLVRKQNGGVCRATLYAECTYVEVCAGKRRASRELCAASGATATQ